MSPALPFLPLPLKPAAGPRAAALLLAALAVAGPASAADALRGKTLYQTTPGGISCANSSCHGTNVSANKNKVLRGANNPTTIQNAINRDTGGMGIYRNNVLTAIDVADIAAYIGNPNVSAGPVAAVTPASLAFGTVAVGSSSAAQTVTLRNSGTAALSVATIAVSNAAFVIANGGSCAAGGSVAAGGSCTVNLQFRPTAAAAASGTLTITHNASPTTSTVSLSGTGSGAAAPAVSPAALNFGTVATGSRAAVQTATVQNSGSAALTLSTLSVSSAAFRITGGSCAAGATVAAGGGSCTVLVDFGPTAAGAASATLSIAHNAAGSPLMVALSGTGATPTAPAAQLSPASLSWSQVINTDAAAQTATLSNTGSAPLLLGTLTLAGSAAADYTLDPGAACTVSVRFRPSATGSRAASLAISHNAAGSPSTLSLNGAGTAQPVGQLAVNRLSLSYPAQPFGSSSAAQTVTVSNSGSASLTIASLAFAGSHAGDFATTAGSNPCSSGRSLAAGASCTADIVFTPGASSGTRSATFVVSAGTAGSVSVGLSGVAAAAAAPIVSLTPASLNFGSVALGSTAAAQTSVLTNSGTAALSISSLRATPATYSLSHDCPATLMAGSHCTLTVSFTPAATGAVAGSIAIASNAATTPDALALSATGVTPVPATLGWIGSSTLSFPDTASGAQSAPQALQLGNSGTSPATLASLSFSGAAAGDFLIDPSSSCVAGTSLAGGARCTVQVVFAPASVGARSATLAVTSGNAVEPTPAEVSGNGIAGGTPLLVLSPTAITLTSLPNQPLQPQVLVIGNQGAGPLNVTAEQASDGLSLLDAASTGGGSCRPVPFVLAPGASCTVVINPLADVVNGTVSVFGDGAPAPAQATVTGSASKNLGAAGSAGPGLVALLAVLALIRRRRPVAHG